MEDVLLILDRGFYSANNLDEMAEMSLGFIIPLPRSNNLFVRKVHSNEKKLSDYKNAFLFQEEVLFLGDGIR
jgi:transposase